MIGNFAGGWAKAHIGSLGNVYAAITLLLALQLALVWALHGQRGRRIARRLA